MSNIPMKYEQNGGNSYFGTLKEDLILSRNNEAQKNRLKSSSLTQTKLKNIQKNIDLQQIQQNDNLYPQTSRTFTNKKNFNNNSNGSTMYGKHSSLHLRQSPSNQQFNNYQLVNGSNNNNSNGNNINNNSSINNNNTLNEPKLLSLANQQKNPYQSHGWLSPSSSQNNQQMNLSFMGANSEEIQQMKMILQSIIQREEEILKILQQRSNKLNDIITLFGNSESFHFANENDFSKFHEAVQELSLTLVNAAKNEIDLGAKCREVERLTLENKNLQRKHNTLKEKCQEQQKINELLSQRNKQLTEENNKFLILLNTEKKDNRINTKKVSALEKRVEFILENEVNVTLNPNDKLRQSLNELLRENESLKRDLAHKNQEIERNLGNMKRMNEIINRLNTKIDSMKKDPSKYFDSATSSISNGQKQDNKQNKESSETNYMSGNAKLIKNDDIDLFTNFVIPQNLDFRIVSMKSDHQNIILDLIEVGSFNFTRQIMATNNQTQQREVLSLISNQFLSFKEISEKVNFLLKDLQILFQDVEWKDVIPNLNSSIAKIFNAQTAHIWMIDCQQGILVTYENGREKKCFISKGILSESFFGKKPINSKNARNKPLYYCLSQEKEIQVLVDTCLVIPIFELKNNQVKMIIEISNSKNEIFSFDEEYLSIIIGQYLNNIITFKCQVLQQETLIKFNQQLFETFDYLMYSTNKFELGQRIQQQFAIRFGITNFVFYYVENDELVKYQSQTNVMRYSLKHGLVGQAALDQKPYIITDAKLSSYYNRLVDLQSILPLFAIPLLDKDHILQSNEENPSSGCLGVIELALKQKYRSTQSDILIDASEGYFGLEEVMSTKIQYFSSIIVHAIKSINRNINKNH